MLFDALKLVQTSLQAYIAEAEATTQTQEIVQLDNIALASVLGGDRDNLDGQVVMSLVNLQEETTLKNKPHYRQENGKTVYKNPPVSLNLYVLFSSLDSRNYETSLKRLSRIIEFFQWRKEFSYSSISPELNISQDIILRLDLYTLTFEQLNHLWGALGGKQVPFVLYRMRLVTLEADKRQAEGEEITEILINE
ncbi:MAG: DUF4255 domain-containing protein [Cyanobacteria bacterium P01_B01_bin.77]